MKNYKTPEFDMIVIADVSDVITASGDIVYQSKGTLGSIGSNVSMEDGCSF